MFPAMLWGAAMMRKRYTWQDTALAGAITGGCFLFFTLGPTASRHARRLWLKPRAKWPGPSFLNHRSGRVARSLPRAESAPPPPRGSLPAPRAPPPRLPNRVARGADSSGVGLALMGAYLLADGFTASYQQALFAGHGMSPYNQALYVGLWSMALSGAGEGGRRGLGAAGAGATL
jgi:hypothetical protein